MSSVSYTHLDVYKRQYDNGSQGVRYDRVSMTDGLLMGIPVIIPSKEAQLKIAKLLDLSLIHI